MVKVSVQFKGDNMTQVREEMVLWAQGFLAADTPVAPPKTRSFKKTPVEAPIPEETQLDLLDPKPQASGVGGNEATVAAASRFGETHGKPALRKLLKQFGVTKVRDLAAEQQVQFITACARGPA